MSGSGCSWPAATGHFLYPAFLPVWELLMSLQWRFWRRLELCGWVHLCSGLRFRLAGAQGDRETARVPEVGSFGGISVGSVESSLEPAIDQA